MSKEHNQLDLLVKVVQELPVLELFTAASKARVSAKEILDIVDEHTHE